MNGEVTYVEAGGSRAAYRSWGEGEPVLYLHGFPTSGYLWRDVASRIGAGFRALSPDFPGFGDSELLDRPHTWEHLKLWVSQFLDTVGLDSVHLAVHDWGGLIGLPWMCENPGRVKSLLITDTSFNPKDRWHALATQWREPGVGEEMLAQITPDGFEGMLALSGSAVPPEASKRYFQCLDSPEKRTAKLEMYRSLEFSMFEPYMEDFPNIAGGKSRVIWGQNDPFVPAKVAHRFGENLGAEVTVLEGAGHFLQEDAGAEIAAIHRRFLTSQI